MDTKHVMLKVRALVAESGLTQQEIGERMGYPPQSARQSVSQFLKSSNPGLGMLARFAKAMGVGMESFF